MIPTNTLNPEVDATADLAASVLAMHKELGLLRSSQIAANREILYLRTNQDRVIHDAASQISRLKRDVKLAHSKIAQMQENQRRLLYVFFLCSVIGLSLIFKPTEK